MSPALRLVTTTPGHDLDLTAFATWLRSWDAAKNTIESRVGVIEAFIRQVDPMTATSEDIEQWLGSSTLSSWSRVTYFSHIRSLYEWLRRSGRRLDDPTVDMRRPREPRRKPRPMTQPEVAAILAIAEGHERTWVCLGLYAGLRAFEIAKFRGEDITEEALFVCGKGGKDAVLPTHPVLWEIAQRYPRSGLWFPSPTSATGYVNAKCLTTRVTRLFKAAGVEGSTHRARHTYATNLLRGGANIRVVQELMRHDSLATTAGYLGVEGAEKVAAIGTLL